MADEFWNSADGAYTTGFAGGPLGAGNRGIFPASILQGVTSAHTAQNAVAPAMIWFQEGFNANIGSSGSELYTSPVILRFEGGGELWFKAGDDAVTNTIIRARPASSALVSANLNGTGTTDYTNVIIQRGNVAIGGSLSTMASLAIMAESVVSMAAGSTVTLLEMLGGTFNNNATVTTAEVSGGVLNQETAVITTELRVKGGQVNLLFGDTYPLINQYGGFVDFTRSSDVKIVTTMNIYGGDYKYNALTTFTNPVNDYR